MSSLQKLFPNVPRIKTCGGTHSLKIFVILKWEPLCFSPGAKISILPIFDRSDYYGSSKTTLT